MAVITAIEPAGPAEARTPYRRPKRTRLPYVLLIPAVAVLGLGLGYPLVRQVVMSFQEFGLAQQFGQAPVWVGLDNYVALLTDSYLWAVRSEEHTSELQSHSDLVCRLLLEKKKHHTNRFMISRKKKNNKKNK